MKDARAWVSAVAVIGLVATACGCASSGGAAREKGGTTCPAAVDEKILNNNFVVVDRTAKKDGGLLDVAIKAQNLSTSDQRFAYRFVWREKGGVVADAPLPDWQWVSARPSETVVLTGKAPTPKVVDFLLSLRAGQ